MTEGYPPVRMELTSLADLLDLQELDLEIDRLLERRGAFPETVGYPRVHETHGEVTSELEEVEAALKGLELELDKSEGELQMLESKLGEHETRLYAGGMSARETEYMRLEVQSLRGQQEAMEERVLHRLEEVDPARERVGGLRRRLETITTEKETLEREIKSEWARIDAELARKEERKREVAALIPADLLDLYESLRHSKEGVAVGRFEHGVCGGCHMALSPAEQVEAMSGDIPRCVHCRRILVP